MFFFFLIQLVKSRKDYKYTRINFIDLQQWQRTPLASIRRDSSFFAVLKERRHQGHPGILHQNNIRPSRRLRETARKREKDREICVDFPQCHYASGANRRPRYRAPITSPITTERVYTYADYSIGIDRQ